MSKMDMLKVKHVETSVFLRLQFPLQHVFSKNHKLLTPQILIFVALHLHL